MDYDFSSIGGADFALWITDIQRRSTNRTDPMDFGGCVFGGGGDGLAGWLFGAAVESGDGVREVFGSVGG